MNLLKEENLSEEQKYINNALNKLNLKIFQINQ